MQLNIIKRLSLDRVSAAIMRVHEENGCLEPLSWDSFRKRLAVAVIEYGFLLHKIDDMQQLGADDYPSGLLSECGGCWLAGQSGTVSVLHCGMPFWLALHPKCSNARCKCLPFLT